MNEKKLYDGLTHIDDDLIEEAQTPPRRRKSPWVKWGAMAACLCPVAAGALALLQGGKGALPDDTANPNSPVATLSGDPARFVAAQAAYPERAASPKEGESYDAWWDDAQARRDLMEAYRDTLDGFLTGSIPEFLGDTAGENKVYSPLNVYLALGMLAEITDGQSRQQILDAMDADDIETLRARVHALWNANYQDDGLTTCLLAGSLWLRDDMGYTQSTLDSLAEHYYASSFRGKMGSGDYNAALQGWLNDQTGGLLKEQAEGVELNPDTVIALATAIYFKAGWADEFGEAATAPDTFHTAKGDVTCDFMHSSDHGTIYRGDGFTSTSKAMRNGGAMWFLLPDEGTAPEALLDGRFTEFLLAEKDDDTAPDYWSDQGEYLIRLSLPKFDVVSDTDLIPGMQAMGINDVFDWSSSDFTPLTDEVDQLYVSEARHAARVKVDEEGVEAAAYTVMDVKATGMLMGDEIDFTLDRPFLFAVTGEDGLPLFVGVVNRP